MKRAILILSVILSTLAVLLLAFALYFLGVTAGVRLDPSKLTLDTSVVRLYDGDGEEITVNADGGAVLFSDLPSHLPAAFVAVEDKRFYEHHGFDYRRIVKAAMKNAASFSFREGASTISQQLVKNTHLTSEKTLSRKLKEFKLTRALEKRYTKEEILELYLNSIYFGHNAFGIGSAARFYFDKRAEDLLPAESAMLAALVKSPNRYSPFKDAEKCLARRNFVLSLMREQGAITEAEYSAAIEFPLPTSPTEEEGGNAYFGRVFEELSELFPDFRAGELKDLRVYTYLDSALQSELDEISLESDYAVLVRDNHSNGIKAISSSLISLPKRLPASTIKPLLVYAPAIEEDFLSPATPLLDEKADFGGYSPSDYGGKYGGYMSARYALAHSVNVPAVKVLNGFGIDRACKYLERMNLTVPDEDRTLALALGGMREGYRLNELADGYATLANGGFYTPSGTISRVEDERGNVLYRRFFHPARVFSEETCSLVTDMLETAVTEGTAKRLRVLPFPVAAKTGTGGTSAGNTDAYTVAYTRDDTVVVWMGMRDNSLITATGGGLPANTALSVLETLYRGGAPEPFPTCDGVERVFLDREAYENGHRLLLADPVSPPATTISELFKRSSAPTETSARFSRPHIQKPTVSVSNGGVCIQLCLTEYYDYTVKREGDGKTVTIYSGKYCEKIYDNSVRAGVEYRYTVIPYYCGIEGEAVVLPAVRVPAKSTIPDNWWD